jgi:RNA methyltransferase, TrmH family
MEYISSARNPRIAHTAKLIARPALRRSENLIVIEGARELLRALTSGIRVKTLFIEESRLNDKEVGGIIRQTGQESLCYTVSNDAFSRIAYRGAASSVVALAAAPHSSFTGVTLSSCPLVLVLESVEKPGNLGAVLRTADAAAADAVIVCDPATDLFNPNVIRSSLGCIFNVPTVVCSIQQAIQWLKKETSQSTPLRCKPTGFTIIRIIPTPRLLFSEPKPRGFLSIGDRRQMRLSAYPCWASLTV